VEVGERGNPLVVAGADVTDVSFHAIQKRINNAT
jgi:hypothetical protein